MEGLVVENPSSDYPPPNKSEKSIGFSPSDYLPIMANHRPISELSSSGNLNSNRSFETSRTSTNSLASSPSSISVNNSIECKNENPWSKRASFPKLHHYLQISRGKPVFSPEQKNWKSGDSLDTSTESFRYPISGSNRSTADLDDTFLSPKPVSSLVKSYSFNTFSSYPRKRSVDATALTSSTRHISPRQKFTRALARTSSFRLQSSLNLGNVKPGTDQFSKLFNEKKLDPNHSYSGSPFEREASKDGFWRTIGSFDRLQCITMLCILTVTFCSYCGCSILAPFFPKKIEEKGLSEFQSGCVFSIYSGVSIIFSPFLGKLVPKFGAKNMILFGILVGGLSNLAFGLAGDLKNPTCFLLLSLFSRATESIGTSFQCTGAYSYIIKLFPNCIGFAFGLTECLIGIALTMGPVFGTSLFVIGGYKAPFFVFGALVLLCFPMSWYFLKNLDEMPEPDEDCSSSGSDAETVKATYDGMLRIPQIPVICLVIVTMALAMSFLEPTFEPHMRKAYNVSESVVGYEFAFSSVAYATSTPVVGYATSKFKNKFTIMLIGVLITLAGLLLIGPSSLLFLPPNFVISSLGLILISFGHGMAFIPTFELILDFCTKAGFRNDMKTHGKVSGLWSCLFSVGEFVGPMLAGSIVSKFGFQTVSTIIGAFAFITVPFIVVMIFKGLQERADEVEAEAFGNELKLNLENRLGVKNVVSLQTHHSNDEQASSNS